MACGGVVRCCLVLLLTSLLPFATTTGRVGLREGLPQSAISSSFSCSGWQNSAQRSVDHGVRTAMDGTLRISGGGMCLSIPGDDVQSMNHRLMKAAGSGSIERVRLLILQGADVNCSNEADQTPLIKAAEEGHTEVVVRLLKMRADPSVADKRGSTALHYAAYNGHCETVTALINAGVAVNGVNKFGYSALHYACADGQAEAVDHLVSLGADVNLKDKMGWVALHRAAGAGFSHTIRNLVKNGAVVQGVGGDRSYSPLHEAVWHRQAGAVRELVSLGAQPDQEDEWSTSPSDLARSQLLNGEPEMLTLLRGLASQHNASTPEQEQPPPLPGPGVSPPEDSLQDVDAGVAGLQDPRT